MIHERKPLPLARLGYWYATLVAFIWGVIFSTGKIERHGKLWVFQGLPQWAYKRGGVCIGACYLTDHNVSEAVLRHEEIHRQQWRVLGLALPFLFLLEGFTPEHNRFEIEAGLQDGGYLTKEEQAPQK